MHIILIVMAFGFIGLTDARTVSEYGKMCKLNINSDFGEPQPLYLKHDAVGFVSTEDGLNEIHLDANEKLDVFCSNGYRPPLSNKSNLITVSCISGNRFAIKNKSISFRDIECRNTVSTDTKLTQRKCVTGKTVEIGFYVEDSWIGLMEICHDNKTASTLWVHHQLTPNNINFQRNVARPNFIKGNFYPGISPDKRYTRKNQRKAISKILGSDELGDALIADNSDLFLARGHLAAKTDFQFNPQQLATFYFINAAPQWQTFNNGNWQQIEIGVKKFLAKRNYVADLYTGTHDIFTYPDVHGKEREIYLAYNDRTHEQQIPVPRYYYKVVIASEINAGIVFIGVNNPYATSKDIQSDYILCPEVSDKVKYIDWDRKNITLGYSYACSIPDFIKAVTHLPNFPKITKLLI